MTEPQVAPRYVLPHAHCSRIRDGENFLRVLREARVTDLPTISERSGIPFERLELIDNDQDEPEPGVA